MVGVEHVPQRLHVVRRRGIPQREFDLIGLGNRAAGWVVNQNAITGAGPGGMLLVAVIGHVEVGVRRG